MAGRAWLPGTADHLRLYERLGLATIPLRPREKRPMGLGWQVPSPIAWSAVRVDANLGVLTGAPSGNLLVLDFDAEAILRERLGISPREIARHTLVVETRRGFHVYARHEDCRTRVPAQGFSVLGTGSFAVAPPSVHGSGRAYRFLAPPERIAPLTSFAVPDLLFGPAKGQRVHDRPPVPPAPRPPAALDPRLAHEAQRWVLRQGPAMRERYAILAAGPAPAGFDRSVADYAVARCLAQGGWDAVAIAQFLCGLPGSKARERGWAYAFRTAEAATRRPS
jgi:hypothetical protein